MINTWSVPKNLPDSGFHHVAPIYDRLAQLVYGNALQQAQLALLPFLPKTGRLLLIGGGSGWLLEQLLLTGNQLDILYLEAAPAMLERAQKKYRSLRHQHGCTVKFRLGTETALQQQDKFDIVFTPFLLDLFPPQRLQQLMSKLRVALKPQGKWLFADFWPVQQPPPYWQRLLVWSMYTFFGALSGVKAKMLPDYAAHFTSLGLAEKYTSSFFSGMVQAKVYLPY